MFKNYPKDNPETLTGLKKKEKKKIGLNYKTSLLFLKKSSKNTALSSTPGFKPRDFIDFLKKLKTYRGLRHKYAYPCRGQRTHTNAKTQKKLKK